MKRREFIQNGTLGLSAFAFLSPTELIRMKSDNSEASVMIFDLLKNWCDGMLKHQLDKPEDETLHGALFCPSCQAIHGRCMDAMYPFMFMYEKTKDSKYLKGAQDVFKWSKNVSQDDGSWTVMADPKSWWGITVFGAIALAETLKYHHAVIPASDKLLWTERLKKAAAFIYEKFNMTFTNINYGFTSVYALLLMGEVLNEDKFIYRSEELAKEIKNWLTTPNSLIFGEGKPSTLKSAKGLQAVDLGYNVEETLNGVVQYAVEKNDKPLQELLLKSLEGHLEFMLPDGGWDNSWGTRMFKWSYWGSRTTDGCQPGFLFMADKNKALGRAAFQSTELLKRCTADGLIHGGLHFVFHKVPPCIHHTFSHSKNLATILNAKHNLQYFNGKSALPREKAYGLKQFPEVDVWLLNEGKWSATVSGYDLEYTKNSQQATGGSLGLLYHQKAGPLFAASMAKYSMVEQYNQQLHPYNEEFALTPRLETFMNGDWYTNLFERAAVIEEIKVKAGVAVIAKGKLKNESYRAPKQTNGDFEIQYSVSKNATIIYAKSSSSSTSLVLPLISKNNEKVIHVTDFEVIIQKEGCKVKIESDHKIKIKASIRNRVFNLVPGFEAIPFYLDFENEVICKITVVG